MNNQPAFPRLERAGADAHDGMTLRDYFAAAALTGLLANENFRNDRVNANDAYNAADAMLEKRDKK